MENGNESVMKEHSTRLQLYMMTPKEKIEREEILTVAHQDYDKKMNSYASFKVSSRAAGQDLVQETFIKTWKYLVRGGRIDVMKSFLYHILNHLIIDEYRKRKISSLDTLLEKGFEPSLDNSKNLSKVYDEKIVLDLIKYLPPKYRKVMRMRYIQDLSLQEISLLTGQTKNAIAVQTHRGLAKLKKLYHQN